MKTVLRAETIYLLIVTVLALCTYLGSSLGERNLCAWAVFAAIVPLGIPLRDFGMTTPAEFFLRPAGLGVLFLFYAVVVALVALVVSRRRSRLPPSEMKKDRA